MVAMNKDLVEEYLLRSLKSLQLEYLDLFLLHKPVGFPAWRSFISFRQEWIPQTRHEHRSRGNLEGDGGAGGCWQDQVYRSVRLQYSPNGSSHEDCQNPSFNKPGGMSLILPAERTTRVGRKARSPCHAYACLGSPAAVSVFNGPKNMTESQLKSPMTEDDVVRIAKVHKKTPGQILLRHLLQLGVAVIPKSSNPERLKHNLDIFDFQLSTTEMAKLNALDQGEEGRKFFRVKPWKRIRYSS
ncbi:1,5-anhydro-D-fructose reductase-like [Homalodisca vitripennis]|uniref:1,5-anhydro-D-fructose reductase-like n=1 Tax=Homalodisca vitripennis TaxID=197043 RepID=UPI001EEAFA40|nr:1,5-anhydro-D-fructose reductase-like [Homalodisca vitripennis]